MESWTKYLEGLQRVLKRQSAALVEGRLGCRPELDEVLWRLWAAGLRRSAALRGALEAPEAERLQRVAEAVPVAATLGVAFLGCCLLREAVLPQDLRAEALAGRLPYLGAHGALPPDILAAVPASRPNGVPYLKPGHLPDPPEIVALARAWAREIGLEGAARSGPERPCVLELNLPAAVARFAAAMSLPPYAPQLALWLFQAHAAWCRPLLRWRGAARSDPGEAGGNHGAVKLSARKDAACYAMALLVVALRFFHPLIGKPGESRWTLVTLSWGCRVRHRNAGERLTRSSRRRRDPAVTSTKKATVKKYVKRGAEWGQAAYLGEDGLAPDWYQWGREQLCVLRDPGLRPTFAAAVEQRAPVPAGAEAEFVRYLDAAVLRGFEPPADLREIAQALGKAALQGAEGAEGAQRDPDDEDAAEAEAAFRAAFCPNQHPYPAVRTGTRFFPVQGGEGKDWAVGTHQEYRIVVAAAAAHIWAAPGNLQAAIRDVEEQLHRAEGGGPHSRAAPALALATARGP